MPTASISTMIDSCATCTAMSEALSTWRRKTEMSASAAARRILITAATAPEYATSLARATR